MGNLESSQQHQQQQQRYGKQQNNSSSGEQEGCVEERGVVAIKEAIADGNTYFRLGNYDLAKSEYMEAFKNILKYEDRADITDTATILSNIGILKFAEGRYQEAQKLLEHSLETWKKSGEEPSRHRYEGTETIAISLLKDLHFFRIPERDRIVAAELMEHSVVDDVIADTLNNVGACCEVQGNLQDALKFYNQSLSLRKMVHGESSLKVFESMMNKATILDSTGRLREAESIMREVVDKMSLLLGKDNTEVAVAKNNLAVLLARMGRLDEARTLLEEVVQTRTLFLGESHAATGWAQRNLNYVENCAISPNPNGSADESRESASSSVPIGTSSRERRLGDKANNAINDRDGDLPLQLSRMDEQRMAAKQQLDERKRAHEIGLANLIVESISGNSVSHHHDAHSESSLGKTTNSSSSGADLSSNPDSMQTVAPSQSSGTISSVTINGRSNDDVNKRLLQKQQ